MQSKKVTVTFYYKPVRSIDHLIWRLNFDFMLNKLAASTRGLACMLVLLSLLVHMAPLQAEPLVNGPAQPANRLIDTSQWLPGAQNLPIEPAGLGSANPDTEPAPATPEPLKEASRAPLPYVVDGSNRVTPPPPPRVTKTEAAANRVAEDPSTRDIRGAVKDVVRPLYEDLTNSDAAQALRGLQSELGLDREQVLGGAAALMPNRPEGASPLLDATTWEGQANREPPRTAAQAERDKVLASVMMDKLIDEVTPWAIGLLALYALFYLVKLVLAYGRHRTQRRRQGRVRRSRRSNPSA